MPPKCNIVECKRISYDLCNCCEQMLCQFHLKQHQRLLKSELHPFINQIDLLEKQVNTLKIENMIGTAWKTLEQWRTECYKTIDSFVKEKCQQLTEYAKRKISEQRENINELRSEITKTMDEQEVANENIYYFTNKIHELEKEINKVAQTCFHIQLQSLVTNDHLIRIKESNPYQLDLLTLSPVLKTITSQKRNWSALATNGNHLLLYQESNLCLVDQEFAISKKVPWSFGEICDIFWSTTLHKFIIINEHTIFLVDKDVMSIESMKTSTKNTWCCGTCSDKSIFSATYGRGSSIVEFSLLPSIEFLKRWKSPTTCSKDEGIHDIIYHDEKLFVIIENQVKATIRAELRSATTLNRIWSVALDNANYQKVQIRCCLFNHDEWIVVYHDLNRLIHISKDGLLKTSSSYTPSPHFASMFRSNLIVIATENSINLHRMN